MDGGSATRVNTFTKPTHESNTLAGGGGMARHGGRAWRTSRRLALKVESADQRPHGGGGWGEREYTRLQFK